MEWVRENSKIFPNNPRTNVLFYKYKDTTGKTFITAKSKGSTFIHNTEFGNFFTLTCQVLGIDSLSKGLTPDNLPEKLIQLKDPNIQSICFELCGRKGIVVNFK
jgi:hypothetical protein